MRHPTIALALHVMVTEQIKQSPMYFVDFVAFDYLPILLNRKLCINYFWFAKLPLLE
jgi:hypothetical protein